MFSHFEFIYVKKSPKPPVDSTWGTFNAHPVNRHYTQEHTHAHKLHTCAHTHACTHAHVHTYSRFVLSGDSNSNPNPYNAPICMDCKPATSPVDVYVAGVSVL